MRSGCGITPEFYIGIRGYPHFDRVLILDFCKIVRGFVLLILAYANLFIKPFPAMKNSTILLIGIVVLLASVTGLKVQAAIRLRVSVPEFPNVKVSSGDIVLTTNLALINDSAEEIPVQRLTLSLFSGEVRVGDFEAALPEGAVIAARGTTIVPVAITIPLLEGGGILLAYFENKGGLFNIRGTVASFGLTVPFSFSFNVQNSTVYVG